MKATLTLLICLLSLNLSANLPRNASEVEITKYGEETTYENIPVIKMIFTGERNNTDSSIPEGKCRDFVMAELAKADANYFRVYCSKRVDVISRYYEYTANLLIKTW